MSTHSNSLVWRIPCTEEPGGLQSMGHKELDTTERLTMHWKADFFFFSSFGFLFLKFLLLLLFFLLYNIVLVLPYINMHSPWVEGRFLTTGPPGKSPPPPRPQLSFLSYLSHSVWIFPLPLLFLLSPYPSLFIPLSFFSFFSLPSVFSSLCVSVGV